MERNQFTFYASFFKAAGLLHKKTERCLLYDTICRYALMGKDPEVDRLPGAVALAWELIRPNLDAGRRRAAGGSKANHESGQQKKEGQVKGKMGASHEEDKSKMRASNEEDKSKMRASNEEDKSKMRASNEEDKGKMGASCGEDSRNKKEGEKEREIEIEDKCPTGGEGEDEGEDEVVQYLLHRVDICPSHRCREELRGFVSRVGAEVCLRAIDEAADAGKPSWAYIRGILRAKEGLGVRSLADWDRLEAQRRSAGGRAIPPGRLGTVPGVVSTGPDRQAVEDMERMRRYMEQLKQEEG